MLPSTRDQVSLSDELLRSLIDAGLDALIVLDDQRQIVLCNRAAAALFGFDAAQVTGSSVDRLILPTHGESENSLLIPGSSSDTSQVSAGRPAIICGLHADGHQFPLEAITVPLAVAGRVYSAVRLRDVSQDRERLEQVLKGAHLGTWDCNIQTGSVVFNHTWAEMLGFRLAELRPHVSEWEQRVHPDDLPQVQQLLRQHLAGETPWFECEYRMRCKSGDWIWICDRGTVIERAPDGTPLRMAGTHQDINARRQAEAEARSQRERFELAASGMIDALWVWDCVTNEAWFAERWCHLLGYTPDALAPRFATWVSLLHPADREAVLRRLQQHLTQRQPYDTEYRMRHRSGEYRWFHSRGQAQWRSDGHPLMMAGSITDITEWKLLVERLRASEERFSKAFYSSPHPMAVQRLSDLTYLEVNDAWLRMTGLMRAEVIGRPVAEVESWVAPELRDAAHHHLLSGDRLHELKVTIRHRSGAAMIGLVSTELIEINHELCVLGVISDVTELTRMQEELQISEERYRSVVAAMSEGVVLHGADGSIQACNVSAEQILGLTREQLLGTSSIDPRWQTIHEDLSPFPGQEHPAMVTLHTGQPCHQVVMGVYKPDGTLTWISINSQPLLRPGEKLPSAVVATFTDITGQRRVEQAQKRLIAILENTSDFIGSSTVDGRILYRNRAMRQLLGIAENDPASSVPMTAAHPPWALAIVQDTGIPEAIKHGIWSGETAYLKDDGTEVPVSQVIVAHKGSDGQVEYLSTVARDISERKRAEEERLRLEAQLYQSQKMESIGTLAGGIAHDFNNLMAVVMGNVRLALRINDSERLKKYLKEIEAATSRASALTRQILSYSRKQILDRRIIQFNQLLEGLMEMLRRLIDSEIEIVTDLAREPLAISADPSQIEQVIFNLVVNARDAMPQGGCLRLSTSRARIEHESGAEPFLLLPGDYVLFTVSDQGCGMDSETLSRALEPFFTTKPPGAGTGLGLSVVYGIVRQHGGFIQATSTPGQGSTFSIYFPAVAAAQESSSDPAPASG